MAIDLAKLAAQGRAYSATRPWETEELDALLVLERDAGIGRQLAADYVRNGIMTVEAYNKAKEAEFKPKTLDEASKEAEAALKDNKFADVEKTEPTDEVVKPKKGKK